MIGDMIKLEFEQHKLRTILTITGVVIGIFLLSTLASFTAGLQANINEDLSTLSGLVTVVDNDISFMNYQTSEIDEDYADELKNIKGVEDVAPIRMVEVAGVGLIIGFNPEDVDFFPSSTVGYEKGRLFEDNAREITLGYNTAEETDLTVGDIYRIRGRDYAIVGIFKETGTTDDDGILTSLEDAKEISGKEDKISMVMLRPEDINDVDEIADRINEEYDDIGAITEKDAQRYAAQFLGQMNIMIYAVGAIAAIIAGIVIMNVMYMSVRELTQQIGTMKALGATDKHILGEIIAESILIAMIGGLIGLGLAFLATIGINYYLGTDLTKITVGLAAKSLGFSAFLGLFCGILPARKAAKLSPIEALRYE